MPATPTVPTDGPSASHSAPRSPSPRPRNAVRPPGAQHGSLRGSQDGSMRPSSPALRSTSGNKMFPRSLTTGDAPIPSGSTGGGRPYARTRTSNASGQSRAISFHPGTSVDNGSSYANWAGGDGERQAAVSINNSSDVVLQGRSYRFQNMDLHQTPLASYTATSNTIRDSTALLAGMALRSDDEASETADNLVDDRIEEDPDEGDISPSLTVREDRISPKQPAQDVSQSNGAVRPATGPSHLSLAFQAAEAEESRRNEGGGAEDRLPSPAMPIHKTMDIEEAREDTPLLASNLRASRGRASIASQSDQERNAQRSASRSKSPSNDAGQSGFSIHSTRSGTGPDGSSTYGYGALAQASHASRGGQGSATAHHVSFAESDRYYDGDSDNDGPLSLRWKMVPARWRPGQGSIPVRDINLSGGITDAMANLHKMTWRDLLDLSAEPVRVLPAVILGMLLNVLDGVSYGLIIFPTSYPMFSDFGGDGVSMFFITCVISQLVYTLGGSIFKGGNGSMMIEVVPFYHILVKIIIDTIGDANPAAVVSTTMVAFALSSIFAGLVFLILGYFRLGVLIGFFPRHILVGCIGGVGVFLIETGMEVAGQLKAEDGFQWDLPTLRYFTQSWEMVAHWLPPLLLAILLRLITAKFTHPLVFPGYFLVIPVIFYIITAGVLHVPLQDLRRNDWVFDVGKAAEAPFWRFYTYFDLRQTSWSALWATMPTQLALTFFSILHVPLNVPALAVSVNEDHLDTDRELLAHGVSNILAGLAGSVPNYLCYVNSVLFYRVGGGNRLSGLMLAAGTFIIFLSGPGAIGYLPIMVVGALIFVLGIDLTKEAVWDTIGRVNAGEYFTIWLIIFVMTYYDFVVGILSGIVVACLFFVIQTSRRRTVRAVLDGSVARSTVRRHTTQRRFLDQAGVQTQIVKLQGFLYFANISGVEELIRRALDIATWQANPIRFLILDFSLVSGVDFSAAEAFTRVQRLLQAKDVVLTFCGVTPDSDVGIALRSVDLWTDSALRLEVFQHLNEALEWTENEYLRSMYISAMATATKNLSSGVRAAMDVPESKRAPAFDLDGTSINSPRRQHLYQAAQEAAIHSSQHQLPITARLGFSPPPASDSMANRRASHAVVTPPPETVKGGRRRASHSGVHSADQALLPPAPAPYSLLLVTFQAWVKERHDDAFFRALAPYFTAHKLLRGEVLWQRGDPSDGFYLIESGILKARYDFPQKDYEINEAMLAGTIAGELTFLSRAQRNTTAYAEMDCSLWVLHTEQMDRLRQERHDIFDGLVQLLLCACSEEQEGLMSYLVSRLS